MARIINKQDLVDALRRNGYPQGHGHMINRNELGITACAMGQAALNLKVLPSVLETMLGDIRVENNGLSYKIEDLNDQMRYTLDQIADWVQENAPEFSVEYGYDELDVSRFLERY